MEYLGNLIAKFWMQRFTTPELVGGQTCDGSMSRMNSALFALQDCPPRQGTCWLVKKIGGGGKNLHMAVVPIDYDDRSFNLAEIPPRKYEMDLK